MRSVTVLFHLVTLLTVSDLVQLRRTTSFTHLNETRHRRHTKDSQISCTLPPQPKNGRWVVVNGEGREGETVAVNTLLRFYCKSGYKLSTKGQYRVCDKNWNTKRFPECLKLCPPMYSTPTITVKCTKRDREIGCDEATEGSYLTYTCATFYEAPFGYKTTFFCSDGDWNSPSPVCQPICGKKVHDDTTPLIYGGKVEEVIEYPWISTVYRKENGQYINICGGSIISQKLILTAAHCVTNMYGDALSPDIYLVAAGKLHNKYNDSRDTEAQYLNVQRLIVHPNYRADSRRLLADIAIILTKEPFHLNKFVQPVCFSDVKNINLQIGTVGVVGGFGAKEDGEPSEELRTLEIPYKSEATCAKELPGDWGDRYNVIDKLCAGHYNKSMSICKGDSGNGLVFRNPENNRYYVHGVVSVGHKIKLPNSRLSLCDVQQNSLYTRVAFHYDFIDREVTKYYIKDCTLPKHPDNGKWVTGTGDKEPGDIVPSSTLLQISCNEGYKLSADITQIKCESSFIMPTCQKLCPEVRFSANYNFNCTTKEGEPTSCNEATDFTTLTFFCPKEFKILDGTKNTRQCLNGTWELPPPACQNNDNSTDITDEIFGTKIICVYDDNQFDNGIKPDDLNATLCTHVIYNSVGLSKDGTLRIKRSMPDSESNNSYRRVADMKKRNSKLKILLTVYGSDKATEYPSVAADPIKRTTFVNSAIDFLETYGYDGVNVFWDTVTKDNSENYIALMSEIKEAFAKRGWLVTASVFYAPAYLGYQPEVLYRIVDWINLNTYNFYNEWSKYTGQNSALYPSSVENDYESTNYNFRSIQSNWESYGFKISKISPTIAFYGRYFTLSNARRHGLHDPVTGATDSNSTGPITYSEICEKYSKWRRVWDDTQKNPYKYYKNKWIGYDDEESVKLKGEFVMKTGFFGVTVYPVNGDDVLGKCGPKQILLKQVHAIFGVDETDLES